MLVTRLPFADWRIPVIGNAMSAESTVTTTTTTPATKAATTAIHLAALTATSRAALDPDRIPDTLKAIPQWVCWRYGHDGKRVTKPPYSALTGKSASHTTNWSTFEAALTRFNADSKMAGIGLSVTPDHGITALDLDHVIDPATGDVDPKAADLLAAFQTTYAEISPSGTGYRLFCYGIPQRSGHSNPRWLELYNGGSGGGLHYLTITGNMVDGHPATLAAMQGQLDKLHRLYMRTPEKATSKASTDTPTCVCNPSDRLAAALKNPTIAALYAGDTGKYGDRSTAEIALALRLMTFADGDEQTVAGWMDGSKCGKWLQRDKDTDAYRVATVKAAAAKWDGRKFEDPTQRQGQKPTDTGCCDNEPPQPDPDSRDIPDPDNCEVPDDEPEIDDGSGDGAEIDRLAALNLLDYDRQRGAAAQWLGIRSDTLDKLVKEARGDKVETGGGKAMCFREVQPWSDPVNIGELLNELTASVQRFMSLPDHAAPAIALWVAYTYCVVSHGHIAPTLAITSPEKRCGKSTLLGWLYRVVEKPMLAANITAAAIFRTIDAWSPTLLIDEADSFLGESGDELRGILNSGHTRDTAYVIRVAGDELEPRQFSTWGAKAVALIGKLEGKYSTLADRSVEIQLRRRLPSDKVEKLRHADEEHFDLLAAKCFRFSLDHAGAVGKARPDIPDALHDRAADNWEPLLSIADLGGERWSRLARSTALALSGGADNDASNAGLGVQLLTDLEQYFAARPAMQHHTTTDLLTYLAGIDDAPWATFAKGKGMTARHLSRLLKPYGIIPQTIRVSATSTPKGYTVTDFRDAFARYLPSIRNTVTSKATSSESPYSASVTDRHCGGYESASSASPQADCGGVADKKPGSGGGGTVTDNDGGNWEEF